MENIYNAIQNVYNMDKTTWQEVLAELYNLVSNVENKFVLFETKFGPLLGDEVTIELKKMYDDGSLASLIKDNLLKDIKTELEAERKRIDSFTTLAEGSTTGDAELIDGRVGVNGRTYTNIGGAIREQVRQLKDNFGTYRMDEIIMTDGQNINLSAGVGNTVDLTPEDVSGYRYAIVDCKEGDNFTISGKGGSNPRLWGFIDSNNVLLSVSGEGKIEDGLILTAPKNATKLIVNDRKTDKISYMGVSIANKITEMEELILETKEQISNVVDLIGIDFFKGKTVTITIPNKYTAWPFIGVSKNKLICVYARGLGHTDSYQKSSSLFVKTSKNGVLWSIEKEFLDTPNLRDTVTGKGNDSNGNLLIWIRKASTGSPTRSLELYRTSDGNDFTQISSPTFSTLPSHIGDIIHVPNVGLMAFYNTLGSDSYSWGLVISKDDGITWSQREIESGLTKAECPVEISCIRANDGKLLAIGRNEEKTNDGVRAQYQLQSNDNGNTWIKLRTNITDISASTASLIYNSETDEISNYYYQRGEGKLKIRKSKVSDVWDKPTNWGASKTITNASTSGNDAGNVNAVEFNGYHIISFYSGDSENTGIYATII